MERGNREGNGVVEGEERKADHLAGQADRGDTLFVLAGLILLQLVVRPRTRR